MANLQALGADDNTIIYLRAEGEGSDLLPFQSVFYAEQSGVWDVTVLNSTFDVTVLNSSFAVTGNFYPDIQAVNQSGVWTITVDNQLTGYATEAKQDVALSALQDINSSLQGTIAVDSGLDQAITDAQLRAAPVAISQESLPGLRIPDHDYIALGYSGDDLTTVVYKSGGVDGVTVAALNLTYSNGNLISIVRS